MDTRAELDDIRNRIEGIIESLDDVTFTLLREASRESRERPTSDKVLIQARRALEKAARLLGSIPGE